MCKFTPILFGAIVCGLLAQVVLSQEEDQPEPPDFDVPQPLPQPDSPEPSPITPSPPHSCGSFNYINPNRDWPILPNCPDNSCGSSGLTSQQSPVNIVHDSSLEPTLEPLTFSTYTATSNIALQYNGHTVELTFPEDYPGHFQSAFLYEVHFHIGGEHQINSQQHAMSMHMLHRNTTDPSHPTTVLAVLFQLSNSTNEEIPFLSPIVAALPSLKPHSPILIKHGGYDQFFQNLKETERDSYAFYVGSSTTPPCTEGFRWFVMLSPLTISMVDYLEFKKVLGYNERPIQRTVNNAAFFVRGQESFKAVWIVWMVFGLVVLFSLAILLCLNRDYLLQLMGCGSNNNAVMEMSEDNLPLNDSLEESE